MFTEDDLLPLSGLQHLAFCERQWALIHLEGQWAENRFTAEGRQLHERADEPGTEVRGDVRTARAVALRSLRLGLAGKADVVEFHRVAEGAPGSAGASLPGVILAAVPGRWNPFPVEYKRGKPKPSAVDEVQVCAQALCLEEMLGVAIPAGAIFYGQPRRRLDVAFGAALRAETERLAARMHDLARLRATPPPVYEKKKCTACSLFELCRPQALDHAKSARRWLDRILSDATGRDA